MKRPDNLNPKSVDLYGKVSNIEVKRWLAKVFAACFVITLGVFIYLIIIESPFENIAILGAVDGILGYSVYPLVKHYFPTKSDS